MAERTLNTRIKQLVMTSNQWTTANPVLLEGEWGYASDVKKYKVGDGTKTWSQLSWNDAALADSATQLATSRNFSLAGEVTATAVAFDGTGAVELSATVADGVIDNANISDSAAIAKTKIAGTGEGKTLADDITGLAAADSAEATARGAADTAIEGSLGLSEGAMLAIKPTVTVGGAKAGTTYSDKSVKQMLEQILCPYVPTSNISMTCKNSEGSTVSTNGEYGTTFSVDKITVSWTAGSADVTDVQLYAGSVSSANLIGEAEASGTSVTVTLDNTLTISGSATTIIAKCNEDGSKPGAGSVEKSQSFGTWYKPFWYGLADAVPATSADVKALTKVASNWSGRKLTYGDIGSTAKYCVLAIESSKSITSAKDPNNFENISGWTDDDTTVSVTLDSGSTVTYKVYHTKDALLDKNNWAYTFA